MSENTWKEGGFLKVAAKLKVMENWKRKVMAFEKLIAIGGWTQRIIYLAVGNSSSARAKSLTKDITNHTISSKYLNKLMIPVFLWRSIRFYSTHTCVVNTNLNVTLEKRSSILNLYILDWIHYSWQLSDDCFSRSMKLQVTNKCFNLSTSTSLLIYI